ncbi:response regulator transcription factor [Paenibacillus alkalitolerans]|uniref:response regulator transcription factor n=1 Tax=Paenibacillus alkalitolerans TaxID=2799335 RepID=UPI0018F69652|nr:response regulator transcription factor [Paenibacillus alkalitolerans]
MYKVVLIDDDRQVLQSMRKAIPWNELNAVCVGEGIDGKEGLRLVGELLPDIVITDVYMPVMNGLEMIKELRKNEYDGKIIILSGYSDFEYAREALKLQVDDYLSKPATVSTIREVIEHAVAQLRKKQSEREAQVELLHKISLYEPFVEREWLKSIVIGTVAGEHEEFILHKHPLMKSHYHLVLGVEIEATSRYSDAAAADRRLFRFAVGNVIGELLAQYWKTYELVELQGNSFAAILHVNRTQTDEAAVSEACGLGKRIIRSIQDVLGIRLRIGVGALQQHWSQISVSTEEAFLALAERENAVCGDAELYVFKKKENKTREATDQTLRPVKFYHQLAESIRSLQEQKAVDVVREFIRALRQFGETRPSSLVRHGSECLTIIRYTMFDVGKNMDDITMMKTATQSLESVGTPEALECWLIETVRLVCGHRAWNENVKHKQAVDFMVQYIHDHYAEEITLTELAEKVYLSRNYLSQLFRDAVGETFNSYVTKVRMEKAKRLLMEGKYLIYEVAEMVGYKNIPYFSTLFKKETGLNPSDFLK